MRDEAEDGTAPVETDGPAAAGGGASGPPGVGGAVPDRGAHEPAVSDPGGGADASDAAADVAGGAGGGTGGGTQVPAVRAVEVPAVRDPEVPAGAARAGGPGDPGGIEIRDVPEDDWESVLALGREAFGGPSDVERWRAGLAHCLRIGAYDAGRLVSFARIRPYQQWFGGRPVPMGGIASVSVTATHQGRGLGRATVGAVLGVLREHGFAVSALFPTTLPLYRGLGWQVAGDYTWLSVPTAGLRAIGPPAGVTLRAATADDLTAIFATYRRVCADTNGLLERSGPLFDLRAEAVLEGRVVVAEGPGGIEGYSRSDRPPGSDEVEANDVVATTGAAARALWFALGAASSTVRAVRANVAAEDLVPLLAEPEFTVVDARPWMLRVVDAPAAVATRGWPAGLRTSVDLDLADPHLPDNAGRWRLAVEDGAGTLTRGGEGTVALPVGSFSALYSGYADPRALRRAGLLHCADDAALAALTLVTAGPRPRLLDYF